ncbi:MAG: cation:dicarboxylase symporter family transporter [Eubacteriales bacterium]
MKKLTLDSINASCVQIREELQKYGMNEKEMIRITFMLEEVLLNYRERFGEEQEFSLVFDNKWRKSRIQIQLSNTCYNPLVGVEEKDISLIMRNLYSAIGALPMWQYIKGRNIITITLPKKKCSSVMKLIIAIVSAVVFGIICGWLPEEIASAVSTNFITPISDTLTGIITAVAGPVIFLSVVWGVYNIGDIGTLESIGKKLIARFFGLSFVFAAVISAIFMTMFDVVLTSSEASASAFTSIFQLFLNMIPDNFFSPFVESNPMQIITLAIFVGIAILILGQKVTAVIDLIEQGNILIQYLMSCINMVMPLFIFISIFNMMIKKEYTVLVHSYKFVLLVLIGMCAIIMMYCGELKIKTKVNIRAYVKKSFPSILVGLATGSSSIAYPISVDVCTNKLGIRKKIVDFGLPFGQVVYMPGIMLIFVAGAFAMSEIYAVEMNITWMIMVIFVSVLLSIATPPITGGALTCYTILYNQLGIPMEALAVTMIVNTFVELLATGINIFSVQSELLMLSSSLEGKE